MAALSFSYISVRHSNSCSFVLPKYFSHFSVVLFSLVLSPTIFFLVMHYSFPSTSLLLLILFFFSSSSSSTSLPHPLLFLLIILFYFCSFSNFSLCDGIILRLMTGSLICLVFLLICLLFLLLLFSILIGRRIDRRDGFRIVC